MTPTIILPTIEREHPIVREGGSGKQRIYRFKNGWGASAIGFKLAPKYRLSEGASERLSFKIGRSGERLVLGDYASMTSNEDEWEVAIIHFTKGETDEKFVIDYTSVITKDVIGHVTEQKLQSLLKRVKRLKRK